MGKKYATRAQRREARLLSKRRYYYRYITFLQDLSCLQSFLLVIAVQNRNLLVSGGSVLETLAFQRWVSMGSPQPKC
jgi:hypothetical protein